MAPRRRRPVFCGTLSKAIGGYGGIISGTRRWIERLKRTSHWYDGASPPPAPVAAATARALQLVLADPGMRKRVMGERASGSSPACAAWA